MDVACLGILVADVIASPIDSLPSPGQLRLADRYALSAGGCAANTAVSLRRFGHSVKVLGKVGKDWFGDFVFGELQRAGVDTSSAIRSGTHQTSASLIVNARGEDRRFIHCIGANADFSLADVSSGVLDGIRSLYVGGYMAMPQIGPTDLVELFRAAKGRGILTALDVVIAENQDVSLDSIRHALPFTDVFLPNQDEARMLTGLEDPLDQVEVLSRLNSRCTVVVTRGADGAVARRQGEILRVGSYRVDAVDPSGAGDAFAAGVLTGILQDWPLEYTLRFASAAGASCTRALGCTAGVFSLDQGRQFIGATPLALEQIALPA